MQVRSRSAAVAVAIGVALLACDAAAPEADPSVAITPLPIDDTVVLERGSGARLELRELGGGPVLLHFWATWCVPCRRELPTLIEAAREHGVRVVAISLDADWRAIRAFVGEGPLPPMIVREPAGTLARTLGVRALPDSYVIDAEGRATRRIAGALDWSTPQHRAWLARTLGGTQSSEEKR